jgi:hypothetical protein
VRGRCLGGAIRFNKNETCWVVLLLTDIKTGDPRLLHAGLGIGERGGFKGVDELGLNLDVDVNDEHG